ncbi:hypothetical protein BDQ17DRAFT_1326004 [Cyathus striatus]|nr:hypothetical protein BDQ17DRAFT_1326004 [Cyathus striatus]
MVCWGSPGRPRRAARLLGIHHQGVENDEREKGLKLMKWKQSTSTCAWERRREVVGWWAGTIYVTLLEIAQIEWYIQLINILEETGMRMQGERTVSKGQEICCIIEKGIWVNGGISG